MSVAVDCPGPLSGDRKTKPARISSKTTKVTMTHKGTLLAADNLEVTGFPAVAA
jgi:hypothetical protein